MQNGQLRHRDDGRPLAAYAEQVAVICPRCAAPGWVAAHWQPYQWQARFRCGSCGHRLEQGQWAGAREYRGHRACGHCGYKWVGAGKRFESAPAVPPVELEGCCQRCGWRGPVPVEVHIVRDGAAVDPHFGLALALQVDTRAGTVWAYNREHLRSLADFAAATLRERGPSVNRSLFSRMPTWMKLARHRVLLQRALVRLQARLDGLPACPAWPDPA
ncbi:hypothetical protein [Stenotrophomonas sp. MMGLT7]|uniref:hypothetical protein n=1 Tax=Stenotrophomonas sp. MMGLT7 TaxID=2901227 RepID=UPI001E55DDC4|nr:hypothetical protein [Stenotrophomonas sp. MMGLT7]MCD7100331.1 hypothetical protein [Stenotrophomonas sp. MMGLT7]